jgi:hypothetical protein
MSRYKSWVLRESTLINKLAEVVKDIYKHGPNSFSIEVKADVLSVPKLNVSYTASILDDIDEEGKTGNADG